MAALIQQTLANQRWLWAGLAGFTLALSFPKVGLAGLGWIAPGMILMAACSGRASGSFRLGYAAGLVHYLVSLHWLLFIPYPMGAVLGWLVLCAYLALYPAVWAWLCWRLFLGRQVGPISAFSLREVCALVLTRPLWQRWVWSVACAAVWVALEMILSRFLTGFPWNLLGASQYRILPVIQMASVTGVFGVSFVMVWFSVALACAGASLILRPNAARLWLGDLLFPLLAVTALCLQGIAVLKQPVRENEFLSVALIQPSIPQTLIWDPSENTNRFRMLIELSEKAMDARPDLVVWPEAAVPSILRYDPGIHEQVTGFARQQGVWMIIGADDAEPLPSEEGDTQLRFFNSSFVVTPQGELAATYRKRRLVAFGEYVPLARWLPFLKRFTPIGEGFTPGSGPEPFSVPELDLKTAVLICFEDIFASPTRAYVDSDTDFLLNLTNNGWFGESAAQWQHAANAVFRAVENRIPLVRCANNGLSCWVDSLGQMHDVYFPGTKDIYQRGFKISKVPLLREGQTRASTFYQEHGDWFGWICVGGFVLLFVFATLPKNRRTAAGRLDIWTARQQSPAKNGEGP